MDPELHDTGSGDDDPGNTHHPGSASLQEEEGGGESAAWENTTMGGDPGDGIAGQQQQQQQQSLFGGTTMSTTSSPVLLPSSTMTPNPYPENPSQPSTAAQQQHQQAYYANTPTSTMTSPTPTSGSITRFATPTMQQQHPSTLFPPSSSVGSSYVERAAHAYATNSSSSSSSTYHHPSSAMPYQAGASASGSMMYGSPYAPPPPHQQHQPMSGYSNVPAQSSPYGATTPMYSTTTTPTHPYSSHSQPQPPSQLASSATQPTYSNATAPPTTTSYASRSAQSYASQSAPPPAAATGGSAGSSSYAARSARVRAEAAASGGASSKGWGTTPAPSRPMATGVAAPPLSGAASYAARSAQAYATTTTMTPSVTISSAPGTAAPMSYAPQSQPPQQQPVYSNVVVPPGMQPPYQPAPAPAQQASSSYAARSAAALAGQSSSWSPQYHPSQQQPQVPTTSAAAAVVPQRLGGGAPASGVGTTPPYGATTAALYGPGPGQSAAALEPQPGMVGQSPPMPYGVAPPSASQGSVMGGAVSTTTSSSFVTDPSQSQALQQRMLTDATRKVQEHAYYMKQAMEQRNLPAVLDRAAYMVGELGGPPHGQHHQQAMAANASSNAGLSSSSGPTNSGVSPKLNPKHYYDLYMRVLEELPTLEDYLLNLVKQPPLAPDSIQIVDLQQHRGVHRAAPFTMWELYGCTQYCPRVVSRLYLQIVAGSALIRSGEVSAKWVLHDLAQAVRCEQNPIRGLFLRHYLLTALRDKLPDAAVPPNSEVGTGDAETAASVPPVVETDQDRGNVKDSYEFVLQNFMEMNKLWVRIQHLPGEGKNKDVRKRRERERNDLRILVGTNLVRLSQLECVTSQIYGEVILPQILEHIVVCGDPLSQAYLMDCLVQVFPDEYHIETMPILLNVCPRLREKVNIRTILQGLMDRLSNYLAEEELLDESDTNQVKKTLARDSFYLFEECINRVYNARGPKLTSKEVIRLQTALLQFSVRSYPGNDALISRCLGSCVAALRQANASYDVPEGTFATVPEDSIVIKALDDASVVELEKLLSIPLETLALRVLELEHYSSLITFLPWANRREVAMNMLRAVENAGTTPRSVKEITELFGVIEPVLRDENSSQLMANQEVAARASTLMAGLGVQTQSSYPSFSDNDTTNGRNTSKEDALVSKLVHLLDHDDPDTLFEMLNVAKQHILLGGRHRATQALIAVVFASVKLASRLLNSHLKVATENASSTVASDEPKRNDALKTSDLSKMGDTISSNANEAVTKPVIGGAARTDATQSSTSTADSHVSEPTGGASETSDFSKLDEATSSEANEAVLTPAASDSAPTDTTEKAPLAADSDVPEPIVVSESSEPSTIEENALSNANEEVHESTTREAAPPSDSHDHVPVEPALHAEANPSLDLDHANVVPRQPLVR